MRPSGGHHDLLGLEVLRDARVRTIDAHALGAQGGLLAVVGAEIGRGGGGGHTQAAAAAGPVQRQHRHRALGVDRIGQAVAVGLALVGHQQGLAIGGVICS